ncbi:MAG TPA: Asp-tRNA(Asn)/Glu-tRNA(Gln) amidotransferase subunit GatC [Deltaproteobacteria bacterium]|nr:Asp-tRNA(Asn)/Glu-tRNA(Gln) amidotransferase subunit GatC [Deltaproteobacteria bacterium]
MKITEADVRHVAGLARLTLGEAEIPRFIRELNSILDHMDMLSALDTQGLESTVHTGSITNSLRDDEARISQSREQAMANAPEFMNGVFVVPKVLE